ncbi:DNA polymerase delta subunit 3 [Amphibalanus amphitrite]|uniref:DNA polymerase delta subunit 3 n=1 Tax=Amphibalanus amphitrite TaxID=1232801 RepID=A0A6A4WF21_AMPAM|nr:DNA polymerase delta subunit 3 [Amphibalanus amphitrite]
MGTDSRKIQEELQFLLEEDNRVITYKFVSANFGIHVNDAKRQLQSLLGACRGRGDDAITATFYLSGLSEEEEDCVAQKSLVVSEDQLTAARSSLTSVTSEHVFSVQRHRVRDTNVLYGADLQERQADPAAFNSHGAITNVRAERLSEAELLKARQVTLPAAPAPAQPAKRPAAPAPAAKKEPSAAADEQPSSESPANKQKSKEDDHNKAEAAEKGKSAGKSSGKGSGNIASMFAKANTEKKTVKSPPKKAAGGGMMASFLKKGADQKPSSESTNASAPAAAAAAAPAKSTPPPVKSEPSEADKTETVRFGAKKGAGGGAKGARGGSARGKRQRKGDSGGSEPAKQRRRIQVASDSSESSDDDGGREEPDPEPEPAPPPVSDGEEDAQPTQQHGKRKRKLVTKTFFTKKEYESCSGSDSEEPAAKNSAPAREKPAAPAPAAPEPAKPSKPKEAAHHKVKQAGIMSFFKKK